MRNRLILMQNILPLVRSPVDQQSPPRSHLSGLLAFQHDWTVGIRLWRPEKTDPITEAAYEVIGPNLRDGTL